VKVGEFFTLDEFRCKDGTPYPEKWIASRLRPLVVELDELRRRVGPLVVVSGFRTPAYNRRIGGSHGSQHLEGRAADIRPLHTTIEKLRVLVRHRLLETGCTLRGVGWYKTFVHVDIRRSGRRVAWQGRGMPAGFA